MKRLFLFILCGLVLASCGQIKFYGDEDIEPSHKITYTSTGGKVEPYEEDFGADIRSNKTEGNQGVIRFWGPVTKIGHYAFYNCDNLTSITIPDSATEIGSYAFADCKNLTSITIPDSVTLIDYDAFSNCSSLTTITIPDSVTSFGWYAFDECTSLKEVYCKLTEPLSSYPFDSNLSITIYVPRNSVEAYEDSLWGYYAEIVGYDF